MWTTKRHIMYIIYI